MDLPAPCLTADGLPRGHLESAGKERGMEGFYRDKNAFLFRVF